MQLKNDQVRPVCGACEEREMRSNPFPAFKYFRLTVLNIAKFDGGEDIFFPNRERNDRFMNRAGGMRHHLPALESTTHHRVTDNEEFRRQFYHYSSWFQNRPL